MAGLVKKWNEATGSPGNVPSRPDIRQLLGTLTWNVTLMRDLGSKAAAGSVGVFLKANLSLGNNFKIAGS